MSLENLLRELRFMKGQSDQRFRMVWMAVVIEILWRPLLSAIAIALIVWLKLR